MTIVARSGLCVLSLLVLSGISGCTSTKPSAFCLRLPQSCANRVDPSAVQALFTQRHQWDPEAGCLGWIWPDHLLTCEPVGYVPAAGDVVLMTSRSPSFTLLYSLGRAGHPFHMGLIVQRTDGSLGLLESGGVEDKRVSLLPLESRLCQYLTKNKDALIWIRPAKFLMSADQSAAMTDFAECQLGKEFGTLRSATFVLPGKPKLSTTPDQPRWFCSEITVEALKQADLVRGVAHPAAILPEDFYHNRDIDLNFGWLPALTWTPTPQPPAGRPLFAPRRPE